MAFICNVPTLVAGGKQYRGFSRRELLAIQAYLGGRSRPVQVMGPAAHTAGQWKPTMHPDQGAWIFTTFGERLANAYSGYVQADGNIQWAEAQQRGYADLSTEELEYLIAASFCTGGVPNP